MHSIEFRVAPYSCGGQGRGETPFVLESLVDGVPFLELVHRAEPLLLSCTCGIDDRWALTAHTTVTDTTVTWSGFRNNSRDWNYDSLGVLALSRPQYEQPLRAALDALSASRS